VLGADAALCYKAAHLTLVVFRFRVGKKCGDRGVIHPAHPGAANGIITIVRGVVVPEMLTRAAYGAINSVLAVPGTIAKAVAPLGIALLWASTGSYDTGRGRLLVCRGKIKPGSDKVKIRSNSSGCCATRSSGTSIVSLTWPVTRSGALSIVSEPSGHKMIVHMPPGNFETIRQSECPDHPW
jgi:hypothetical protein